MRILLALILVVALLGAACTSTEEGTLSEDERALLELKPGPDIPLEIVVMPESGDTVVVFLNCEVGLEELTILGQYLEVRGYIPDLLAKMEAIYNGVTWVLTFLAFGTPLGGDMLPEEGVVIGILRTEYTRVLALPFVVDVRASAHGNVDQLLDELLEAMGEREEAAATRTGREQAKALWELIERLKGG